MSVVPVCMDGSVQEEVAFLRCPHESVVCHRHRARYEIAVNNKRLSSCLMVTTRTEPILSNEVICVKNLMDSLGAHRTNTA